MKKLNLLSVLVVTIFLTTFANAATYYVDAAYGSDSNSGTSTSSPWKTIAKVNSLYLKPGDVVRFKRGAMWKETLYVKYSGTSSAPITFTSYGSGNLPVIDGSMSRQNGILMDSKSYIIIREFKIQNTTHGAVRIKRSRYITVRNCEMYITGRAGVFIEESSLSLVSNNKMSTPSTFYNVQTDGIYAQRNSTNTYDGNNIVISNQHTDQHCDAIQFYLETSAIVKNNYVEQHNTKGGNAQGIYCSENYGLFKIYNNIAYGMYTTSGLIKFMNTNTSGKSEIIGNTVYGGKNCLIQINDPYVIFKNNIIMTAGSYVPVRFDKSVTSRSNINYNLYKRNSAGTSLIAYNGTIYTMTSWKNAGFDSKGMEADPKFYSISSKDFRITSGSPALNKGLNMNSPFNYDRLGTVRPYGTYSDIGAYEMKLAKEGDGDGNGGENNQNLPGTFELSQNYPNPFNPSTTIRFTLPQNSEVSLKVYDITGAEVADLVNEVQTAGTHEVQFDASKLASGTYIYRITAGSFNQTKKMILLK